MPGAPGSGSCYPPLLMGCFRSRCPLNAAKNSTNRSGFSRLRACGRGPGNASMGRGHAGGMHANLLRTIAGENNYVWRESAPYFCCRIRGRRPRHERCAATAIASAAIGGHRSGIAGCAWPGLEGGCRCGGDRRRNCGRVGITESRLRPFECGRQETRPISPTSRYLRRWPSAGRNAFRWRFSRPTSSATSERSTRRRSSLTSNRGSPTGRATATRPLLSAA